MVSVLAFYSHNPSLNPAEVYSFCSSKMFFEKNENKQKSTVQNHKDEQMYVFKHLYEGWQPLWMASFNLYGAQ